MRLGNTFAGAEDVNSITNLERKNVGFRFGHIAYDWKEVNHKNFNHGIL